MIDLNHIIRYNKALGRVYRRICGIVRFFLRGAYYPLWHIKEA